MKIHVKAIFLTTVVWCALVLHSYAADAGTVNLVKPVAPPLAVEAVKDAKGGLTCEDGLVLQKNGHCCPKGSTNDNRWPLVCTPPGLIDGQIFNYNNVTLYCPSADMLIVSDKNNKWFSCAGSDSTVLYPLPDKPEAYKFCLKHGYGYLIKILTWRDAGCIKYGESQGDGCIEAGTCFFGEK